MASTVTQFPPPSYSSSYFVRNIVKEFLTKRLTHAPVAEKSPDGPSHCDAAAAAAAAAAAHAAHSTHAPSATNTGEKGLDLGDLWRSRPAPAAAPAAAPAPPSACIASPPAAGFKRWRRGGGGGGRTAPGDAGPTPATSPAGAPAVCKDGAPAAKEERSLLKFLALNALDLTAPASDVLLKNRQNAWFQLSGHPDCFAPAGPGTIWKKHSGDPDNAERQVYEQLGGDPAMQGVVPRFFREVDYKGEKFIELQDLLHGFSDPHVMDIKMGTRTFLESEVQKTCARHDLYLKMVQVDPTAPTPEEHEQQAVTKLRYMQFREQQSSTCSQGFRIEAMKFRGSPPVKDLKKVKSRQEVLDTMALFLGGREDVRQRFLKRLAEIRNKFEQSLYFQKHEVVGSSIFMIYDDTKVGAWIIDFAKTLPVPEGSTVNHRQPWVQGNHEEGFLFGLDSLISVMEDVDLKKMPTPPSIADSHKTSSNVPLKS